MRYLVTLIDTDPDTGDVSQRIEMCTCSEERHAVSIKTALTSADDSDPNREYMIEKIGKTEAVIVCADTDQLQTSWECQKWLKDRGTNAVVCFSIQEQEDMQKIFTVHGIPYMVAQVGTGEAWHECKYDLKLSDFVGPDDFEVIHSVME
jgi:hypothetical protein